MRVSTSESVEPAKPAGHGCDCIGASSGEHGRWHAAGARVLLGPRGAVPGEQRDQVGRDAGGLAAVEGGLPVLPPLAAPFKVIGFEKGSQFLLDRRGLGRRIRLVNGGHELGDSVSHSMPLP